MDSLDRARTFFNADRFRYLVQLKYLHLYPERLTCAYVEHAGSIGVLLSYSTDALAWDRANYDQTRAVLIPAASDVQAAEMLLQHVRETFDTTEPLVVKFCEATTRDVFTGALPLSHAKT